MVLELDLEDPGSNPCSAKASWMTLDQTHRVVVKSKGGQELCIPP